MGQVSASSRTIRPSACGLRALVTRPQAEGEELAAALAALGVEAIVEPMIEIRYRDRPAPDLAGVQAVLCTSGNGVRALAQLCRERTVPLYAVGDATAARARAEGFAQVESAGGAVADLVRLVATWLRPDGGPLLHVTGSAVAGDLAGELRVRGFAVERATLYEAQPRAALSAACAGALAAGMVDFALFFSPRTAAIFARLVARAGLAEAMSALGAVSISAAADSALAPLRFRVRQIAERPDQPSLLAALDRAVAERCRR